MTGARGKTTVIAVLTGSIALILISFQTGRQTGKKLPDLPFLAVFPDFRCRDQNGRQITRETLSGKIWVADLIEPGSIREADLLSGRFAELDRNFRDNPQLGLVSFLLGLRAGEGTVLAQRFEASRGWLFLHDDQQMRFALPPDLGDRGRGGDGAMLVFLVDRQGRIRQVFDGRAENVVADILIATGVLLREGGK